MSQAFVDEVESQDITVTEFREERAFCSLGFTHQVFLEKVKDEVKIYLIEGRNTVIIS